jgi:hypothetical protein
MSGRRGGFPQNVDFTTSAGADCTPGTLSVDDVRAVLDPSCPE